MLTSHIQGPIDVVVLGSDKGFMVKIPPMLRLLIQTNIWCLTVNIKKEMVVEMDF